MLFRSIKNNNEGITFIRPECLNPHSELTYFVYPLPMVLLYSISIHLFYLIILVASLVNKKAGLWISGRKDWRKKLSLWKPSGGPVYWFHAASLGEFEQGRPLIEEIKRRQPGCSIVLTFYSPSGFEVRKNYQEADFVGYLPLDTLYNAGRFIKLVKPQAVFFIKYEFWFFYLKRLHDLSIPVYLISGIFRQNQIYFRWYGSWFRKKLRFFRHFFIQDHASADLLGSIGFQNVTVSGDTRFDRVTAIGAAAKSIEIADAFTAGSFCIVAGSTWPADEALLVSFINETTRPVKLILAPHEIGQDQIKRLSGMLQKPAVLYSEATPDDLADKQVLIINNIGMLSSLYRYGKIAYLGGGFGKGIHNILEPAAFGLPVIFGPNYKKFQEARALTACGGAFAVNSLSEFKAILDHLMTNSEALQHASSQTRNYVSENTGATHLIVQHTLPTPASNPE